ncbi:MAG: hypothetical protein SPL96_06960 [Bacteroidales bacterium]|nr:hypothetical protein [Bacteroidales bacterium]
MKKIYMILAAMTLLSMSLNAQLLPQSKTKKITGKTEASTSNQNGGMFRAPAKYALQDGEYFLGPYDTDDYGTTGYTLYQYNSSIYSSQVDITSVLDRSEVESHIGDEIIGFRFATRSSVGIYGFVVSTEGPNHWIDDIYSFSLGSNNNYVTVTGEGWHEYTLNEPVEFQIADSVAAVWIGYSYRAPYGTSNSNKTILVNPNSTGHDTYAYDYYDGSFYDVTDFLGGDLAVQLIMRSNNKTPKPEITYVVNGDNVVITATGQGEVTLNVTGQDPVTSNGSASVTVPRTDTTYSVTATATAKDGDKDESDPATETITVPFLQTEKPSITYTTQGETVVITATATEPDTDAEVTLTVGNGEPVTGIGSVSVTVPCGVQSSSVTATATAQVNGKAQSETETAQITIPAGDGWTQMTETYDNPTDLLSFKVKVGADTTMVMMIDQFLAPTVYNDHPSSYTYVLKETINGEEKSSNPATVPVYKTNSTMYSLYTEEEVLADNKYDDNKLKANVLNSEIDYDVVPDNNVLYYSLYRGGKDEPTPVVDVDHRISQLQKFEDKVGDNVTYYLTENHLSGITPRYEHIGSQIVERLDMDYVTGTETDKLSYVPVIWTFGLYTARGDGKNNSYGSDIKNSYVGKVNISVEGYKNDGNNTTGQWKDPNGTTYCVYSPKITLNGFTPEDGGANDGDTYQYVPYMYRVWCTYPNAHNFTLLANPDGKVHLADAGPITAPFLIGQATAEDSVWHNNGEEVIIGRALASGEAQQPWSFGVPVNESSSNVKFVARFYYKKIVTPAAQANGLRGNRGSERAFAIAENSADGKDIVTGINELADIVYVVSTTYVNAQGMQSDKPFDGLNIVVTRYSDGTTTTTKVVR